MFRTSEMNDTVLNSPIEKYILAARSATGAAAADIIKQATEDKGVYGFGELLFQANIRQLREGEYGKYYELLKLFAYGSYSDYKERPDQYTELTSNQLNKLRQLSIVSLAAESKFIPYSLLLQEVDIKNIRELEDLIIEATYAEVIKGKLDQKNSCLEISFTIARDYKPESDELSSIKDVLFMWNAKCETALAVIDELISICNSEASKERIRKAEVEKVIEEVKNQIRSGMDEETITPKESLDKIRKFAQPKPKGRGSKSWPKKE